MNANAAAVTDAQIDRVPLDVRMARRRHPAGQPRARLRRRAGPEQPAGLDRRTELLHTRRHRRGHCWPVPCLRPSSPSRRAATPTATASARSPTTHPTRHQAPSVSIRNATSSQIGTGDVLIQRVTSNGVSTDTPTMLPLSSRRPRRSSPTTTGKGTPRLSTTRCRPNRAWNSRQRLPGRGRRQRRRGAEADVLAASAQVHTARAGRLDGHRQAQLQRECPERRYDGSAAAESALPAERLLRQRSEPLPNRTVGPACKQRRGHGSRTRSAREPREHHHLHTEPHQVPRGTRVQLERR